MIRFGRFLPVRFVAAADRVATILQPQLFDIRSSDGTYTSRICRWLQKLCEMGNERARDDANWWLPKTKGTPRRRN